MNWHDSPGLPPEQTNPDAILDFSANIGRHAWRLLPSFNHPSAAHDRAWRDRRRQLDPADRYGVRNHRRGSFEFFSGLCLCLVGVLVLEEVDVAADEISEPFGSGFCDYATRPKDLSFSGSSASSCTLGFDGDVLDPWYVWRIRLSNP